MRTLMIAPCAGLERCLAAAKSVQDQQQLLNASRRSPGRWSQVSQEPPECEDEGGEKLFLVAPGSGIMSEVAPKPHPARQTALSGSVVIGGSMTESNFEMSAELTGCHPQQALELLECVAIIQRQARRARALEQARQRRGNVRARSPPMPKVS